MKKNATQTSKEEMDPVKEYNETCKNHVDQKEKNIWLCYDCHKFTCTKCYAKEHKHCWADLIENMYSEMEETNKANLEAIRGMRVVMDLVVNHTSDHHKWFKEALSNPESPYRMSLFLT